MSSELREAIVVGIELILFSLLIVIVAFFGGYSQDALNTKTNQEQASQAIENYANIYEFTSGIEIDYEYFSDKGMDRTTTGSYRNLNESAILEIYRKVTNNSALTKANLPEFYLTTGDDIARFIALFGVEYDIVVANLDNTSYNTVVFTDMVSVSRKDEKFSSGSGVELVTFTPLSTDYRGDDNQNKINTDYTIVNDYLGDELGETFYCIGVYDSAYNTYDSILFYKKK